MKEYWKDNLGVELDVLKRESGMPRREGSQLYRINWGSWIPDPALFLNRFSYRSLDRPLDRPIWLGPGRPPFEALLKSAQSLPVDHPDRCAAFQAAVEQEFLKWVYIVPIREVDPIRWLVQPWLRGFKSTFNQDFNTLTTAYVVRH